MDGSVGEGHGRRRVTGGRSGDDIDPWHGAGPYGKSPDLVMGCSQVVQVSEKEDLGEAR